MSETVAQLAAYTDDGTDTELPGMTGNIERHEVVVWLEQRVNELFERIKRQEFWKALNSPSTDPAFMQAIMREQYLQIIGYQPDAIEGAIASIGQFPRSMDPRMVRSMLVHQADEWDHGEMALRDYVGLGGNEQYARSRRMSPEAYAVAAVWRLIAHKRDPFCYLGALYLFEGLTPKVTATIKENLRNRGLEDKSLEYIEFHSTEDIKHANLVHHLISSVARQYPESVEAMKYGYECFEHIYPIPVWSAAYMRAKTKLQTV
jgi:pyrroloquinoline quinone (PQQ) biosynthesis protein C